MKKYLVMIICSMCVIFSQAEALSFISDGVYYYKLMQQKKQIIPKIISDLIKENERYRFDVVRDGVYDTSKGLIEYELKRELPGRVKENIFVRISHAKENEKPYTSIHDWFERAVKVEREQLPSALEQKTEIVRSNDNDILVFCTTWHPKDGQYPPDQFLFRAVYYKGRIFLVNRTLTRAFTSEEKQEWINRLENLSYMNNLAALKDQPDRQTASTSRKRR